MPALPWAEMLFGLLIVGLIVTLVSMARKSGKSSEKLRQSRGMTNAQRRALEALARNKRRGADLLRRLRDKDKD